MGTDPVVFKRYSALLFPLLLGGGVLLSSSPAFAAGFFLPTRGVESTGRGGATIAPHRGDLNGIWFNPAGLSLLEERQLVVDLGIVGRVDSFQRAPREMPDGSIRTYEEVSNQAPPNTIPQILVGGPTGIDGLGWAVGAYTGYTGSGRYDENGPQRYVLIDNTGSALGYIHAALGWQVNERLSIGGGIQNFMGSFRVVTKGSGYAGLFGDPEDEDLDMLAETTITSFFGPSANLGVSYLLTPNLQTGLSFQLPTIFRDREATIDVRVPEHVAYDNATVSDDRVDISIPFPFYARAGLRYFAESFDIELAIVYQHWSSFDELEVSPAQAEVTGVPGVGSVPVDPFTLPQDFRNTFSLHLGGDHYTTDDLTLRGGLTYERGAVPDHTYSSFNLDPDKFQLSFGGSFQRGSLRFDATLAGILMPTKVITNSEVRQVNPSEDEDQELTLVVGNGTYRHFGYIAGFGVRYLF